MVTLTMLKDYATLIAATITAIGVIVAVLAYLANRRNQREALVQKAYYDYAKMAVDMPELAFPPKQKFDYANQTLNGETLQFEKYEWFVSSMLVTVHFILRIEGRNKFWRELAINQIAYHWRYLQEFSEKKQYLVNWRFRLGSVMTTGIDKGRREYS
jgi:hypothetical protein